MKPSLRSPRAPSTSRPKPPDGPTMPRFGGASSLSNAEGRVHCLRRSEVGRTKMNFARRPTPERAF
jgi:hypothetical protein